MYTYMHVHVCMQQQLLQKETINLKESKICMGVSGGRKGKEEII